SVWANYAAVGVHHLLLADAVETRERLDRIRGAIPGAEIIVCRLTANLETMKRRIRMREPGMLQEQFLERASELNRVLDEARLEDFTMTNEDGAVTEVAHGMLERAGWLPSRSASQPLG
ncbi:MAG TPA: hypothetical protein VG222_15175, partial [Vicinamibacterales bacterium]|nr:hypothetical protein [Vicinamibacterales bacterium]